MIELPKISIVVPNYNGGKTLEATLRSLLDQNYPNLEIIVIDGGSKDNSIDIIKKYEKYFAFWVSEPDRGQSDAINKGMAHIRGDIVNWLCSDDLLTPGSLETIGRFFDDNPNVDVLAGRVRTVFPDKGTQHEAGPTDQSIHEIPLHNTVPQSGCFWRRRIMTRTPLLLEDYHFKMDAELWCFFLKNGAKWHVSTHVLAVAVQDGNNKTRSADYRYYLDHDRILRTYMPGTPSNTPRWFRWSIRPLYILEEKSQVPPIKAFARYLVKQIGRFQRWWRNLGGRKSYRSA